MHGLIPDMLGTHLYWNILGDVVLTPSSETPIACTEKDCKDRINGDSVTLCVLSQSPFQGAAEFYAYK